MKYIPNIITILRILLIIPISWLIWEEAYKQAFVLILIAGLSDGIDGFLARHFHWQTRSGAIMDPLADKIFLVCLFIIFGLKGLIPAWLMYLVIARDIIILAGAIAYHFVTRKLEMRPLIVSKLNTALQIALLVLVALKLADIEFTSWLIDLMVLAVGISTLISGSSYVALWTRYALQDKGKV